MKPLLPFRSLAASLVLAGCAATGQVLAQDAPPAPADTQVVPAVAAPPAPSGSSTRDWLALQRSGRAGSAHPIPGEIATLSWRRHVDSFRQPIPESFTSPLGQASDRR